jgi:hypothetical protein
VVENFSIDLGILEGWHERHKSNRCLYIGEDATELKDRGLGERLSGLAIRKGRWFWAESSEGMACQASISRELGGASWRSTGRAFLHQLVEMVKLTVIFAWVSTGSEPW